MDSTIVGIELFDHPELLGERIGKYFEYIDAQPARSVNVGKNIYTRKVPYTEDGLCFYLGVQKGDVKRLLDDPGANAQSKKLMTAALTRIKAYLTEAALLGELDATVAKVVLSSSLLSGTGADAEIEAKNGLKIRIEGMTAEMVEKASR